VAVTYPQFVARIPGKRFEGLGQARVDAALAVANAEISSEIGTASHDELVHWLTAHKLWLQSAEALTATPGATVRNAPYLAEYKRLARAKFAGPRVF